MGRPPKLSDRQKAFIREYLLDMNASAAYLRAGYKSKNPNVCGPQLLANPSIRKEVEKLLEERSKRTEINADYVLTSMKEVGERCMQRVPVMVGQGKERKQATEWINDPNTGEMVEVGVWEFDSQGALRALEGLGKHLKLFTDKTEVSGPDGGPVELHIHPGRRNGD